MKLVVQAVIGVGFIAVARDHLPASSMPWILLYGFGVALFAGAVALSVRGGAP